MDFINEKGVKVVFDVAYEWKPTLRSNCKKLGHEKEGCKKQVSRQEWRVKSTVQEIKVAAENEAVVIQQVEQHGFEAVGQLTRKVSSPSRLIATTNTFTTLEDMEV